MVLRFERSGFFNCVSRRAIIEGSCLLISFNFCGDDTLIFFVIIGLLEDFADDKDRAVDLLDSLAEYSIIDLADDFPDDFMGEPFENLPEL